MIFRLHENVFEVPRSVFSSAYTIKSNKVVIFEKPFMYIIIKRNYRQSE